MAGATATFYRVPCPCGGQVAFNRTSVGKAQKCPWCRARYQLVMKKDPDTGKSVPALAPAGLEGRGQTSRRVKTAAVPLARIGAQEPAMDGSLYRVHCLCGVPFSVAPATPLDIVRTCEACHDTYRIMMAVDPSTKKRMIVSIPARKPS